MCPAGLSVEISGQESLQIVLKSGRTLDNDNSIIPSDQSEEAYYVLQFQRPIAKEEIDAVKEVASIDGYLPPYGLILKISEKNLAALIANTVGSRAWKYTDETNYERNLRFMSGEVGVYVELFKSAEVGEVLNAL